MKRSILGFCPLAALFLSACGSPAVSTKDPRTFSDTVKNYTSGGRI